MTVNGPHTNMVFVTVPADRLAALLQHLQSESIRVSSRTPTLRLVTHLDLDDTAIERAITAFSAFFR